MMGLMTELWQLGALELAEKIRAKEVSSREVLEVHLARVEACNGSLNAIVRVLADEARAAADDADAAVAAGRTLGPLHGVPCTVKENIDVAGTPTTQGVTAFAEAIAPSDAPTVERMRAAGAIPFARTNLPDFGLRVHTHSQLHGLTRNPWNPDVTTGGSSGGEASAIASGMSPIGLGNDIGGSLRNPAHCCGIASLKPTVGVIPMATSVPPEDMGLSSQLMVVEGPMARHVADVRAGLEILAGRDWRDPRSVSAQLVDAAEGERIRIAVLLDPPGGATDPGIAGAIRAVADRLADAGHDVVEATPPGYERTIDLWRMLMIDDVRAQKDLLGMVLGPDAMSLLDMFDATSEPTRVPDTHLMHIERYGLMRAWSAFHQEYPVLISPTWAQRAFVHGADLNPETGVDMMTDTIRPVLPSNLLGTPAAVTPAGVVDGLPVGVQVLGDRFTDLRCLTIAAEIESLVGRVTPIDPITTAGA
jgi:amidase